MRTNILRALASVVLASSFAGCSMINTAAEATKSALTGKGARPATQRPSKASAGGKRAVRRIEGFRRTAASRAMKVSAHRAELASLPNTGSLWSDTSPFFFADRRARKVGDIVTVIIKESSNAKKEADTEIDKETSLTYTVPALPGFGEPLAVPTRRARRFDPSNTLRTTSRNDHETETEVERTDTLNATIAAKVVEVLPNGNLLIEGRRELTTHKETLVVTVSGIVRPEDISSSNTIESKNLADAKIVYTGEGLLAEAQSPGWLARVVNIIWPF